MYITVIHCFVLLAITVRFGDVRYRIDEDIGVLSLQLILNNLSSFVEDVTMINIDNTANGT